MSMVVVRRRRTRYAVAAVALAALAGCGSTVQLDGPAAPASGGEEGLGLTVPTTSSAPTTATTTTLPVEPSHGGPTPASTSPATVAPPSGSTGTGTTSSAPAPSKAPLEVGTYYLNGGNAALSGLGFGGLIIPDNKPVFDAFMHYINNHGGVGGRQIKPVYYQYNEGGNPQTQDAAACSTFTQDHHVSLVFGGINSGAGLLLPCLAQHGVPLIGSGGGGDARYFEQYRDYDYEPDQMNFTTGLRVLVEDMKRRGYLANVHKVGVVQYPGAIYTNAVNDGLAPALAGVGLKIDARATTGSTTDNGAIASSASSAELHFATEGINLVIFMTPGGAAETYFMTAASTQHYKPKYGIWSADSPYVLEKVASKGQLQNTIGIGYEPGLDVASAQDPTAQTKAGRSCLAFGRKLHVSETGLGNGLVRAACDDWLPILQVAKHDPQALDSASSLAAALDSLGSSYQSASTFAMRFTPDRHDEAHGYRDMYFNYGCACFKYVGATRLAD
ncbi:MAG TPA: ABC transporter substrate-binding protein [Mycobacteriales bacterium]|nr:ABC transporter substrate-binding protein [Mycobacteriales bacterium]